MIFDKNKLICAIAKKKVPKKLRGHYMFKHLIEGDVFVEPRVRLSKLNLIQLNEINKLIDLTK